MPLLEMIPFKSGDTLGIWHISESADELTGLITLSATEEDSLATLNHENRITQWLATRCLLRRMVGPGHEIAYQPSGKPDLTNTEKYISVSHTSEYAAVMLSHSPVGIDLERRDRTVTPVVPRFLSTTEQKVLNNVNTPHPSSHLLAWCAKEALYKWDGAGSRTIDFKHDMEILDGPTSTGNVFPISLQTKGRKQVFQAHYVVRDHFVLVYIVNN
ncbi:MAG: 4'-phosphopantetheinyl transferase superfamily protein [Flavobacteriales bacterium]|nr:4'-phosphopantetheinyl transferase superfamily protein [Flavobacteriales bacterium]